MAVATVFNPQGKTPILIVCEHASNTIPEQFDDLGLDADTLNSHVAWDLGALEIAKKLTTELGARLVYSTISRLVYDCNRPPLAHDAMPASSEVFDIPGNKNLTISDKEERIEAYYLPFKDLLKEYAKDCNTQLMVTIHSFTPVYYGKAREVEIGILHDSDSRFADAMLSFKPANDSYLVRRNEPYGAEDGVTHTLIEHGIKNNLLNVMIEVRNDLLADVAQQDKVVDYLAKMIRHALVQVSIEKTEAKL